MLKAKMGGRLHHCATTTQTACENPHHKNKLSHLRCFATHRAGRGSQINVSTC
ncbi:hypothetical protein HanRHA438_Chr16g0760491 [Helianthus annuus]|nr:hypothetical protein HanRHA438_Chr16g0760491 [Helianthus annuus]